MQNSWAAENLQVIRTLMERSALYRRALAPIMLTIGVLGSIAGVTGRLLQIDSSRGFVAFWFSVGAVASISAFLLVRRQALKEKEPFWSPPTRRIVQAVLPSFFSGAVAGIPFLLFDWKNVSWTWWLPVIWMAFYGCALYSAGSFMPRGIKLLGWAFVLVAAAFFLYGTCLLRSVPPLFQAHAVMGAIFGGSHLAYGIYLYFTERKKNAA